MPINPTYPGVYIEELPSGVATVSGVGTSITAFVGIAFTGPVNEPTTVSSFREFERTFGGLWFQSGLSYAVYHYFLNGGTQAVIVRVLPATGATKGTTTLILSTGDEVQLIEAASGGSWYEGVYATVDHNGLDPLGPAFNLTLRQYVQPLSINPTARLIREEVYRNAILADSGPQFLGTLLGTSNIARYIWNTTTDSVVDAQDVAADPGTASDGVLSTATVVGTGFASGKLGIYALEKSDLFNILCIPPITRGTDGITWSDVPNTVWAEAAAYAAKRRAILLVDPPVAWTLTNVLNNLSDLGAPSANAALYFPRVIMDDPLRGTATGVFAPSGAVAGIIARTDVQRGVWKAPAGLDARLIGVSDPAIKLRNEEIGLINPLGVNVLKNSPDGGSVVWGARTTMGADRLLSDWKYLPVRRLALFLEESLYRGIQWAVFEPNDASLWAQLRLGIGSFMQELFRQGAFRGAKPNEAYYVKCDSTTTTQDDINHGIVNIIVGFAPLKPAEFVIIKLQQMAGQVQI